MSGHEKPSEQYGVGETERNLIATFEERQRVSDMAGASSILPGVPSNSSGAFASQTKGAAEAPAADAQQHSSLPPSGKPKLAKMAMRVRAMNLAAKMHSRRNLNSTSNADNPLLTGDHTASGRDDMFGMKTSTSNASPFVEPITSMTTGKTHVRKNTATDNLFENAHILEQLFEKSTDTEETEIEESRVAMDEEGGHDYDAMPDEATPLTRLVSRRIRKQAPLIRIYRDCCNILKPFEILRYTIRFLLVNVLCLIAPLLVVAWILYYKLGNPELQFLPSTASISWWLIFAARQLVTYQIAKCTEYIFVDVLSVNSTMSVRLMGPLITLCAIQSKGWPFVIGAWGGWDLIVLHGDHPFAKNWLYFLDIDMFDANKNPDYGIIESDIYLRFLLAMLIVGGAAAIKRTHVALYFGKRTFLHYAPELESLVANMRILVETADLAAETDTEEFSEAVSRSQAYVPSKPSTSGKRYDLKFKAFQKTQEEDDNDEDDGDSDSDDNEEEGQKESDDDRGISFAVDASLGLGNGGGAVPAVGGGSVSDASDAFSSRSGLSRKSSGVVKIKNLLDRWQEPQNKLDEKSFDPSIHDILQFRRAMDYLSDAFPFSHSFGPADSRDRCIKSAKALYCRLLRFTPGEKTLPFEVLSMLAYNEYGDVDEEKLQALTRLFRPGRDNDLTTLAFVQSCDFVYRKLRYLRASVSNSSLIDKVLEQMFNGLFYFLLLLIVMTILEYDPWTLLVSISTLLVSFAFAVGPSAAKYIEGILLIAVRRPFDLGDRISIVGSENVGKPGGFDTYFVEDTTLFTTTLRFAATNEISTVNNFSIANSRIVNHARSPKALVTLQLPFFTSATMAQIEQFRASVDRYVKDHPREWTNVVYFRYDMVNQDDEYVEYGLRVQHVKSWQDVGSVLISKGDLMKFCHEMGVKMGITWELPIKKVDLLVNHGASREVGSDKQGPASGELVQEKPKLTLGI